jgi:hypothetical protein
MIIKDVASNDVEINVWLKNSSYYMYSGFLGTSDYSGTVV